MDRLVLTGFRNYETLRLDPDRLGGIRSQVIVGANGAGKTNLLEALSLLGPGRGLRGSPLTDIPLRPLSTMTSLSADPPSPNPPAWAVAARIRTGSGDQIDLATGSDGQSKRRQARVNGRPVRGLSNLSEHLPLVWLTPDTDRLFQEGAAGRRRFLDRMAMALDPDHSSRSAAYAHSQRERMRVLRDGTSGSADRSHGSWLDALEESMARHGVAIAAARRETADRLTRDLATHHSQQTARSPHTLTFPHASLRPVGLLEEQLDRGPALAAEDWLRAKLHDSRQDDSRTGSAAFGPHRSDVAVRHLGRDIPIDLASTGERKAVLVAFVLSLVRVMSRQKGRPPIVLLDEVAAHLDAPRRDALAPVLSALGAQFWVTGTDTQPFESWEGFANFLHLKDGAVVDPPVGV